MRWMPIFGYEECYSISDEGEVARTTTWDGNPTWKLCKPRFKSGYPVFHLSKDGKTKDIPAHRAVWQSFNGPIEKPLMINHKNGVKTDNRLSNLELVTNSGNQIHSFRVLKRPAPNNPSFGSRNGAAKLSEADIPVIRALYSKGGIRQADIGKMYGVSQRAISLITRGEKWTHV